MDVSRVKASWVDDPDGNPALVDLKVSLNAGGVGITGGVILTFEEALALADDLRKLARGASQSLAIVR